MKHIAIPALMLLMSGCAANRTASSPYPTDPVVSDPSRYLGDPELYTLLARTPHDSLPVVLGAYERRVGGVFADRLGDVVEDSLSSFAARAAAIRYIGETQVPRQLQSLRVALHARDPRIRALALNSANAMHVAGFRDASPLLQEALADPAPELQAKALQFIGDSDVETLRRVVATARGEILTVARGVLQAAEERGVPLIPDSAGVLQRTAASGYTVRFEPTTRWPQWGAATGRVTLRSPAGTTTELDGQIEVVGNVVPVFFAADGKYVVYEADRHIRVRELGTGAERDIGPGAAPRIRPVTEEFLFVREDRAGRAVTRDRTKLRYEVMSMPFDTSGGPAYTLGFTGAFLINDVHGNYSPVRWMRVAEKEAEFSLVAESLETFKLPSPFGSPAN